MAPLPTAELKTSFTAEKTVQPYYSGAPGCVAVDTTGRILVTACEDEVVVTDLKMGVELERVEGDGEDITALSLTPNGEFLVVCYRSLLMRTFALTFGVFADADGDNDPTAPSLAVSIEPYRQTKLPAPVMVSAIDSTGTLVATGGADGLVKVWDIRGGFVTHNIPGHGGKVSSLAFYISSGEDGAAEVDVADAVAEGKKRSAAAQKKGKKKQEFKGRYALASGGDDTSIRVFDLETEAVVGPLMGHTSLVRGLDWSENGRRLVSGGRDGVIVLWDTKTWKNVVTPAGEAVEAVGFLKPGAMEREDGGSSERLVYVAGSQNRVRIWDLEEGKEVTAEVEKKVEDEDEDLGINQVIYHPTLDFLMSVHNDYTLQVHPLKMPHPAPISLPVSQHLTANYDEIISLIHLPPTSSLLALATNAPEIRIVDANTFRDVHILRGHTDTVLTLSTDWSGRYLASAGKDNDARVWYIPPSGVPTCISRLTGHTETIAAVALPPTTPPSDSAQYLENLPPKFVLTGAADRTIKKWDLQKSRAVYTRRAHDKDINALALSPDSRKFASASQDRTIKIWDTESGETIGVLRGHRRGVWDVSFSPVNGQQLLSASTDKTVKLWSLSDYTCIRTFEGHTNTIQRVIHLSAHQLASAGNDGLVKVWNVQDGECVTTLDNHNQRIWALSSTPSADKILSADAAGIITIWRDTTQEVVEEEEKKQTLEIEQTQHLENFISLKDYRSAVTLALQLNHPGKLLHILQSSLLTPPSASPAAEADFQGVAEVLTSLSDSQLTTLLLRVRDWNTNAKTAIVAQKVLGIVVRGYRRERLVKLKGADSVWDGLKAYTERHYRRVEELKEESWVLEWVLENMDVLLEEDQGEENDTGRLMIEASAEKEDVTMADVNGVVGDKRVPVLV
ncbi:WD40 repeat-like protein [Ascodesmis nigricans]|uniref:WD40 repeat-like protein n=1 Tax=Ascodesmis nigricans TaxID=341454 RepID=A0A4S2N270_9PEZI|nr:WD40 repeat-like protein [Ascodesmis nigricans]